MHQSIKRLFVLGALLLLTGCLWGPGRFTSNLLLKKDGSFVLDYRGEIVLQVPPDAMKGEQWSNDKAHCYDGADSSVPAPGKPMPKERACSSAEIASQRAVFETAQEKHRRDAEAMAKAFGLPGLDDESNRAFAAKLMKYAGWRSVSYRGNGIFDVDYHLAGRATQDFIFPALPDNDLLLPFIAIRRRSDGSVLVTAPALTGGAGPLMGRMAAAGAAGASGGMKSDMVSHAQGRFTVMTDGEILTNNSEDGAAPHPVGRQLHWDVGPSSAKIPETLIRL